MRINVDRSLCTGHGICESIAEDLFALDDDGQLHVATGDISAADEPRVDQAVEQCPAAALSRVDPARG